MKDREIVAWGTAVAATIAAVLAIFFAAFPQTKTVTVKQTRKQTLHDFNVYLTNHTPYQIQSAVDTKYGTAMCETWTPLEDGRTLLIRCLLYRPVQPGLKPAQH